MEGVMETESREAVEAMERALHDEDGGPDGEYSWTFIGPIEEFAPRLLERIRVDVGGARAIRDAIDPDGLRAKAARFVTFADNLDVGETLPRHARASYLALVRAIEGTPDAD